ncbi:MAG TPA: SDR family oxidoreductase [Afifellaceae bacterium]|nr:SDR family oxidoreductase [Afifellaceae bacterium]
MKLFCFGMGYSARATVARMMPRLDRVWGTTRSGDRASAIVALGAEAIVWSGGPPNDEMASALTDASHVLVSVAPDGDGDPVLNGCSEQLAGGGLRAVCYLSTVGVYGDHGGAWVDETSECKPVSERSKRRVAAEKAWLAFGEKTGLPVSVIRLSGIYGPGRGPFRKLTEGTSRRIVKAGQVFNRIHVDDIAQIVEAALLKRAAGIFNGTDDEPAPPQDVSAYAAGLLGIAPPPEVPFEEAEMTPMARSFYGENKRVRNDRIKRELGVALIHPTYREGLAAVAAADGG